MASKELTELSIQLAPKSGSSKYKVKKGDTLSGIASQLGVGMDSISGYRSGNKDMIYEGEELNVGTPAPKKTESSSYVDEVKTQLNEGDTTESDDPYGLGKVRLDIEENTKKRDDAFAELKDISTKTFEDEYESRKLEEKKQKMSLLDGDIASKKAERDAAINKVRSNPGLSAAQMTGDIKKMSDYANNEINNLIAERNGVAGEYNNELEEIDRLVTLGGFVGRKASEKVNVPLLLIITKDDASGSGPRLPGIQAAFDKVPPGKKQLVILEGSAHAQLMCETEHSEKIMKMIVDFLKR